MPSGSRPHRPRIPVEDSTAEIVVTDDGSRTVFSPEYDQTFHSESGALSESKLVFIENSLVHDRLNAGKPTSILEIGFGTGLNFCLAANVAIKKATPLVYQTIDLNFLPRSVFSELGFASSNETSEGFQWLNACYDRIETLDSGQMMVEKRDPVALHVLHADATDQVWDEDAYDAVFLDAFSPEKNPELWSVAFFEGLHQALKSQGRLTTYCVKSEIQRRLREAGFAISKTRGPVGGKREVLIAVRQDA